MTATRIVLGDDALLLHENVWSPDEAAGLDEELRASLHWEQHVLRMFGRDILAPRLSAWYGDEGATYRYSGLSMAPLPWTSTLLAIRSRLQAVCPEPRFNSVLANLYRDGQDSMGWHSDDEPELGPDPVIASVSFGGTRAFRLGHRQRKETQRVLLPPGSVLIMPAGIQERWRHAVPKTRTAVAPRVNLTFRAIVA